MSALVSALDCWSLSQSAFTIVDWDRERVVYASASGETHFLNATGARVLDCLSASPVCFEDLLKCVVAEGDLTYEDELRSHLLTLMRRFEELGIVIASVSRPLHEA